ncbi:phenylacetyl-CoA ligase [Penicillium cataractarum]|uniref:Phenylacetyl-CoA ligase n=1 Tax=Penicillium cataractarum TaxID=2100454 RepID=A0A9W9SQI5_9EURO|nr:phenylacetyl-CoA ligase [Penicillium cataractarum]KAJ5381989.1 phenylacetyl-CoA ligase [Penicillium cataractarum]
MATQRPAPPIVPTADIWEFLFERPSLPFPPDHVIFCSATTGDKWTYKGLRNRAEQFGLALQSRWRWSKDDVLMVMSPNDIDTPPVIWGCHYAGGIVAPVNPALSIQDLRQQIERSEARGLVVHPDCLPVALKAARIANIPTERILALRFDQELSTNDGISTVDEFIASAKMGPDMISYRPKIDSQRDTAFLVYSSGTTGHPKGVMVSHRNVVADVFLQSIVESDHIDWRRDRTLAVLPIYHIYG